MSASQHTIAGTVITMPVKIRTASQHMAMFSVDADAAQRLIDYSGLKVCRYIPGRAIVVLMLMHYIDGDLGYVQEQIKAWEAAGVTMMVVGARSPEQIRDLAALV